MIKNRKAVIFGTTGFAISCMEYLLKNKWQIIAVVTDDDEVINWCNKYTLQVSSVEDLFQIEKTKCYLFSIINPYIISDKLLGHLKPIKAINYHDSMLPKYAGKNSTTWAILNNEKFHGITWHQIVSGIDEGDIYYQKKVLIHENDTAFDLNLKCTEAAFIGFTEVISNVEHDMLSATKQNLTNKTYFGLEHIPDNYAYLNSIDDLPNINRIINGLNFGDKYLNPVATAKVSIQGETYIIEKKASFDKIDKVSISNCQLKNIYGRVVNPDISLIKPFNLSDAETISLKKIKKKEQYTYGTLSKIVNRASAKSSLLTPIVGGKTKKSCELSVKISVNELCAFLSIILNRLNSSDIFLKIYYKNNEQDINRLKITEQISLLNLDPADLEICYSELGLKVNNSISKQYSVAKDFAYRYKLDLCSDFAVVDGFDISTDEHQVVFFVNCDSLIIQFCEEHASIMQMIAKCIEALYVNLNKLNLIYEKIKDIPLLSEEDYQKVIYDYNQTDSKYPQDKTIHELFEAQALKTPNNIAVVYENTRLTYEELNIAANQLAAYLRKTYKIRGDDLIPLFLERSEYIPIAILGVLKSGAGYVPIDPSYPDERITYILGACGGKVILANQAYKNRVIQIIANLSKPKQIDPQVSNSKIELELIDDKKFQTKLKKQLAINLSKDITSRNLAYVIYTSGTTGNPKGVMIEHTSVVNYNQWMISHSCYANSDIVDCSSSISFDATVNVLLTPLVCGQSVVICKEEVKQDIALFIDYIAKNKINLVKVTPTYLSGLIGYIKTFSKELQKLVSLRCIIVGGEKANKANIESFIKLYPKCKVLHHYGPTETTVGVTSFTDFKNTKLLEDLDSVPLGRIMINNKAYVLDNNLKPMPIGGIGMLYIGGASLARGYLNREDLTKAAFLVNPYQTSLEKKLNINDRIYKTGDLVRIIANGNIEYISRNDFQVKIRGYRIELAEIEHKLLSFPGIKQAIVLALDHPTNNSKYLVGYYISDKPINLAEIIAYLGHYLPDYMIPNSLMHLELLPLNINGKLDHRKLPVPDFRDNSHTCIPPRDDLDRVLVNILVNLMGVKESNLSINDDFFNLGIDSISAIQIVGRIRQQLGISIHVKDIFSYKTIEELVDKAIRPQIESNSSSIVLHEEGILTGAAPLLPIQTRFFSKIANKTYTKPWHWNQAFSLKIPEPLNLKILSLAIESLIKHHDAFRLSYKLGDNQEYSQFYVEPDQLTKYKINYLDINKNKLTASELKDTLTSWQSGFSPNDNYMFQIGVITGYEDNSSNIYFAIHHLLIDTVSWRIICHDLETIYKKLCNLTIKQAKNIPISQILGTKGTSYRQWAELVNNYANMQDAKQVESEKDFWSKQLAQIPESKAALDKLGIQGLNNKYTAYFELDLQATSNLILKTNVVYKTEINDILLTALSRALTKLTGNAANHIILEGHGREESISKNINISNTVGWFTSIYPIKLISSPNFSQNIIAIKENSRSVPHHGIGYGALFGYNFDDLPKIKFNYLGQLDNTLNKNSQQIDKTDISDAFWQIIADENTVLSSSANEDDSLIDIYGRISLGKLSFSVTTKLGAENTNKLNADFETELLAIIDHTLAQNRTYLTASDVDYIVDQDYLDQIQKNKEISGVYLANSLQQGFIYHYLNQGNIDDAYLVQKIFDYNSSLNPDYLKFSWNLAIEKYPSLRLRFAWDNQLVQIIDKQAEIDFRIIDITEIKNQEDEVKKIIANDRSEHFDLSLGNLLRVTIVKLSDALNTCIINTHHSISDGWSNPNLLDFVHSCYLDLLNKTQSKENLLANLKPDHAYLEAQKYLQQSNGDNQVYFQNLLAEVHEFADLSFWQIDRDIRLNDVRQLTKHEESEIIIDNTLYQELATLSQTNAVSISSVLQYVWHKLLSVYGNTKTTVTGTTISGRNLPINNIEDSVGLYINTLPLIIKHENKTILEQIKFVQDRINELNEKSNVNLGKLQTNGKRLFDSLFIYENYAVSKNHNISKQLNIGPLQWVEKLDYPLCVTVYEKEQRVVFNISYEAAIFKQEVIIMLLNKVKLLLGQIVGINHNKGLSSLSLLTDAEYQDIVVNYNSNIALYPQTKMVHQLFEEQVIKTPDNVAAIYEDVQLTYNELNMKANQLATYLKSTYQLMGDNFVALCMDRSEQMLISILAILKSGATYVPMDPSYPDDRISFILADIKSKVILTNKSHFGRLGKLITDNKILIDVLSVESDEIQDITKSWPISNLSTNIESNNLAYMIYTSGTTGLPKGVMVEHRNVVNLLLGVAKQYEIQPLERMLLFANYVFDAAVEQMFLPITTGGTLIMTSEEVIKDSYKLLELIKNSKITHLDITPAYLGVLDHSKLSTLNRLISGGEHLSSELYKKLVGHIDVITNSYGPTEATVTSLIALNSNAIGKPIQNVTAYVLDTNLNALPIGAVGELYIGGAGLARGYFNRDDLTKELFLINPYQSLAEKKLNTNSRIYRTGDLVRMLADGNIEYIGRNDFQVKIKGYRIELGEIETMLLLFPLIKQAVVLAYQKNDNRIEVDSVNSKYLIGYYVSDKPLNNIEILEYLAKHLPDYMVPSSLVHLECLPLNISGKLDYKALPKPEFNDYLSEYIGPRDKLDKSLVTVVANLLGLQDSKLSITADFFRLGGDSITSIQLVGRIRQKLGFNITVKEVFTYKTIEALVDKVIRLQAAANSRALILHEDGLLTDMVPLLPIQKYFFSQVATLAYAAPWHYNQSFMLHVPKPLELDILSLALKKLVEYHDGFRLNYKLNKNAYEYSQIYIDPTQLNNYKINYLDISQNKLTTTELNDTLSKWQSQFNPTENYMFQIGVITGYEDKSSRIYFALHHLLVDAISWRIICHDLEAIYVGLNQLPLAQAEAISASEILGPKGTSYRQWANLINNYTSTQNIKKIITETKYWNNQLSGLSGSQLVMDALEVNEEEKIVFIELDTLATSNLILKANLAYNTEINDILLTALSRALANLTNMPINHIMLEGHGREGEIATNIDISNTVGWFTSLFPLKLFTSKNLGQNIILIKENIRLMPYHGIGFGPLFGYNIPGLPKICFNYLGQLDNTLNQANTDAKNNNPTNWQISRDFSGISFNSKNKDDNLININGRISFGKLSFSIATKMSDANTNKLKADFEAELLAIIDHAVTIKRSYLTANDVKYVAQQDYLDQIQKDKEVCGVYRANSLQQGFIYHYLNQGNVDDAYIVQAIFEYKSKLNLDHLKTSWNLALAKYPSLRLRFAWDNQLVQIIDKHADIDFRIVDITKLENQKEEIDRLIAKDRAEHFDLAQGRLLRITIIKQNSDHFSCIMNNHHAILDGWSCPRLLDFVHRQYCLLNKSTPGENLFTTLKQDYTYFEAQDYLQQNTETNEVYFQNLLAGVDEFADLSYLQIDRSIKLNEVRQLVKHEANEIVIRDNLYQELVMLSQNNAISINSILQYVWHKLLSVYGNTNTTITGTTISGRNLPIDNIEDSVGLYINTLPLIIKHSNKTILEQIKNIQDKLHELNERSNVNLAKLQMDGKRLFNNLFIYENYPAPKNDEITQLNISFKYGIERLDYPLCVIAYETEQKIIFKLKYDAAIFSAEAIKELLSKVELILSQVVEINQVHDLGNLTLLTGSEYERLVMNCSNAYVSYPDKLIHELFEEQVLRTPDNIAIVYENIQLTYQELNVRANKLAGYLRNTYQLVGDDLIALCMMRSEHMLIALLAILKSSAAYVPLDPNYPSDRISYILGDTKAKAVITDSMCYSSISECVAHTVVAGSNLSPNVLMIDNPEFIQLIATYPEANLTSNIISNNLAYVIYTSGTTGMPKGVMVEHENAVNLFMGLKHLVSPGSTWLAVTNVVFDIASLELIGSLVYGAKLIITHQDSLIKPDSLALATQNIGMEFGLFYFGNEDTLLSEASSKYELLIEGAKFADANDFSAIWTPERHFNIFGGLYPNPTVTSAAIATITKNIKIRSGSIVLPLHNPIRVAEDWALIDNLSNGRVGLSLATGWHENDFTLAPNNFSNRKNVLMDNLVTLQKLWLGESVELSGVDGNIKQISTFPRPIQAELPIWLTVAGNPESYRQAGSMGANLLTHLLNQPVEELANKIKIYKDALVAANHNVQDKSITLMIHTFISDSEEYSRQQVREPFKNYLKTSIDLVQSVYSKGSISELGNEEMDVVLEQAFERYYYTNGLFGTIESCQAMIEKLKSIGITEIACLIDFGIPHKIVLDNLKYLNKLRLLSNSKAHKVTHLQCTPSLAQIIFASKNEQLKSLNTLLIGGEQITSGLVTQIKQNTQATIYNMYGPTETTIWSTYTKIANDNVTIGCALPNEKVYVLDRDLNILPVGAIGELYIGGKGVARGYLNQDELTYEKFIDNPFQTDLEKTANLNSHIYKTGDLVRILADGNIEYIGRSDFQVKIRGHRIELGEIEAKLAVFTGIKQAVVLALNNLDSNNQYLVAYYVSEKPCNDADLLLFLSASLPEYMIPSIFVHLTHLPLTINGKLDRKALPKPEFTKAENFATPQTELETKLCTIYAEVLGLDMAMIGINDGFFKMGGNSVLVVKLHNRLNQLPEFKDISIADLFKYDTVHKLTTNAYLEDSSVSYKLQNYNQPSNHEIAVIGISGAFSGAASVTELWNLISTQREGIRTYSLGECRGFGINETMLNDPNYIPVSSSVPDIDLFDPSFWEISANEARNSDPQIRKFVEHCWYALEQAGYIHERQELNIGVFAGSGANKYFSDYIMQGEDAANVDLWEASMLNAKDALATRAAYLLGLTGPAYSINTACSTGLVSVVEASQKLKAGTCDIALAGGVFLSMPDQIGYIYQNDMILSRDGHCRTFDKDSSGTTDGAGVGVVLLKRLDDAVRDKDNIICVIKGYATNNDGNRKTGYTAPSVIGQSECILNAQAMAGIKANQIDYIECHGTATNLGDPIEVQALKEAFESNSDISKPFNTQCYLGSVKANIGHAGAAAGIAGLIKVCSMLEHSIIPGQVNFTEANPKLRLDKTNFTITKVNSDWKYNPKRSRIAGVSSFGIGGTNAHVIVGEYIQAEQVNTKVSTAVQGNCLYNNLKNIADGNFIFPISAKSYKSLIDYKAKLISYLRSKNINQSDLSAIAYTLQAKREIFNYRLCINAQTPEELISKLESVSHSTQIKLSSPTPKIIFMFPGQGAQYHDMAIDLYSNDEIFKSMVDEAIAIANEYLPINLSEVLYPSLYQSKSLEDINQTKWAQISLFIISYSMANYLKSIGIIADAYIGHSIGEYVAATLSGVLTLKNAIELVILRGQVMQQMSEGGMLAINSPHGQLIDSINKFNCEIAALNSPENTVVAGNIRDIDLLKQHLEAKNIPVVKLNTSHAYHSRMMDLAAVLFKEKLTHVTLSTPSAMFISNVSGKWAGDEVTNGKYWCQQLRNKVEFSPGIQTIANTYGSNTLFLEVGVGKALNNFVANHKYNGQALNAVQLLPSFKDKQTQAMKVKCKENILSILWEHGAITKLDKYTMNSILPVVTDLPVYQFDFKSYWIKKGTQTTAKQFNNLENIFYKRQWESAGYFQDEITSDSEYINILVLVNADKGHPKIAKFLSGVNNLENVTCVYNSSISTVINGYSEFDFRNEDNFKLLFKFLENNNKHIQSIIYFSSTTSIKAPELDIIAIKSIMNLYTSSKNIISKFISISLDNFKISGTEDNSLLPSIAYGVTKSLNTEYLNSQLKTTHFDFSSEDSINYSLYDLLKMDNKNSDLVVIRNNNIWIPKYIHVSLPKLAESTYSDGMIFLITGGLGAIGHAYANYITSQLNNCVLILVGSSSEDSLKASYKERLAGLRQTNNKIIYIAADISSDVADLLINSLQKYNINTIDYVLHAAGKAAKSYMVGKTVDDIRNVVSPKIIGFWNIMQVAKGCNIKTLINCSSISSIRPETGNLEYTAANSFLDGISYGNYTNINKIITINLNQISDIGMAVDFMKNSNSQNIRSQNSILSTEVPLIISMIISNYHRGNIAISRNDILPIQCNALENIPDNSNLTDSIKILNGTCSNLEYEIAQVACEVLGIEEIDLNDDFFRLGGNSILAIKFTSLINKKVAALEKVKLKVSDVSKHKNVKSLANYITTDISESLIKPLNNSDIPELLFMIHPGGGGTEVYTDLASQFTGQYKCYGVDNYNIQNETQISDLYKLAELYLSSIEEVRVKENVGPDIKYNLFGWSSGGQIALAIANILEKKNSNAKVEIVCLDTVLNDQDEKLTKMRLSTDTSIEEFESRIRNRYKDETYINQVLRARPTEEALNHDLIKSKLCDTKITLFKAKNKDNRFNPTLDSDALTQHILDLPYNNLDKVVTNMNNLEVVVLDCHHWNILDKSDDISRKILG